MRRFPKWLAILALAAATTLSGGCYATQDPFPLPQPTLSIYTCQEESIYAPLIKEYQERTGQSVSVFAGNFQDLEAGLADQSLLEEYDLVFGADAATLTAHSRYWQPYESPELSAIQEDFVDPQHRWTAFCTLPVVILYNTRIVTYRELPEGWNSLLEPRWKGRIAFVDPTLSAPYAAALTSAWASSSQPQDFLSRLYENLDGSLLLDHELADQGVADGRFSIGISLEEDAERLRLAHPDIDYAYPKEGFFLIPDGSAIIDGCAHPQQAREFLDFTISKDAQRILGSELNRRPVRTDVTSAKGLVALGQLPILPIGYEDFYLERAQALQEWQALLPSRKGEDS